MDPTKVINDLWNIGVPLGMLAIAILYFWIINKELRAELKAVIIAKDLEISNLNKELRSVSERSTDKLYEFGNNTNAVLNGVKVSFESLKETIKEMVPR